MTRVNRIIQRTCCLLTLLASLPNLYAQSNVAARDTAQSVKDTVSLTDVTVYGYFALQLASRQAYHVTAVDARKLQNTTLDIASVLDRVPGARLRETGGVGSVFDFSLNGFSGKRIKFFLDGVPMEDFGPSFQINNIPINLAERVEVYKGVIPIWLGSDALGGAVNIITNNRMRNYLDISYAHGSFNTHRAYINAGYTAKTGFTFRLNAFQNYSDNDYKITLDVADIHTGRYYPNTTLRRFHDRYHNEAAIATIGFVDKPWADQLLLVFTAGNYYKEIQTGIRLGTAFGAWHARGHVLKPTLNFQKKNLFGQRLDVVLNGNYNFGQEQSVDTVHARYGWLGDSISYRGKGGENWYSWYVYRNNVANAMATATYSIGDKQYLAINNVFSYFGRKGSNRVSPHDMLDNIPRKTAKNILGLSYQYTVDNRWNATIFGKYSYQRAQTTRTVVDVFNPRDTTYDATATTRRKYGYGLSGTLFFGTDAQLKLSYEKTHRMPESEDLFGDITNKDGNWNLKPETSDNVNLGFSYRIPWARHRLYLNTTGLFYYARDFIYYSPLGPNPNKLYPENLMNVSNWGLESEIRYTYDNRLSVGANLSYQNIRDRNKYRIDIPNLLSSTYKERIPNVPYLYGNADASYHFNNVLGMGNRLNIGYNMLYVHSFFLYWENQAAKDSKRMIPQQLAHDVSVVYSIREGRYNVAVECNNIANRKLYDNFSLQKPGRSYHVKLRYFISK